MIRQGVVAAAAVLVGLGQFASASELLVNGNFESFPYWGPGQNGGGNGGGYQMVITDPGNSLYVPFISGVQGWKCFVGPGFADQGLTDPGHPPSFASSDTMAVVNAWDNFFAQTTPDTIVPGVTYTLGADFAFDMPDNTFQKGGRIELWAGDFDPNNPNVMQAGAVLVAFINVGNQNFLNSHPDTTPMQIVGPNALNRIGFQWTGTPETAGKHLTVRFCALGGCNGQTYWDNFSLDSNAPGRVIHVNCNGGSDANDGSAWSSAKASINAAVYAAVPGDEIWVAKGTYAEDVGLTGRSYALYGGFVGTETDRSQAAPWTNATIIDQRTAGFGAAVFVWGYFNGTTAIVDGFRIRGLECAARMDWSTKVVFRNCRFRSVPNATLTGPAVDAWDTLDAQLIGCDAPQVANAANQFLIHGNCPGNPGHQSIYGRFTIENCYLGGENAGQGTALFTNTRDVAVRWSVITSNNYSAGAWAALGTWHCTNLDFENNTFSYNAGCVATIHSSGHSGAAIANNQMYGNWSGQSDMLIEDGSAQVVNNTICNGTGRGVVSGWHGNVDAYNNIIAFSQEAGLESWDRPLISDNNLIYGCWWGPYNNRKGMVLAGTHDIFINPLFVDPSTANFRITALSAAQDAGDPSKVIGQFDVAGNARLDSNGRVDMGAFEDTIPRDTVPPVTTATLNPTPNAAGWLNRDCQITLSATDASGIWKTAYEIVGVTAPDTLYTGAPFTTPAGFEGTLTVRYHSWDAFGGPDGGGNYPFSNMEAVKELTLKIDQTAPVTTLTSVTGTLVSGWYIGPATVTLAASDNLSGVAQTYWQADSNPATLYTGPFKVSAPNGIHTVSYWSVDTAGNVEGVHSFTLQFDTAGPRIQASLSPKQVRLGASGASVLSGSITDAGSGVQSASYVDQFGASHALVLDPATGRFSVPLNFDTSAPATFTITVNATDNLGQLSSKTLTFTVR